MIKLVGLDLDGTLLNDEHKISNENKAIIDSLKELGVKVVLASGREVESMIWASNELKLDTPLIALNGAIVTDNKGEKIIFDKPLNLIKIKDLFIDLYNNGRFMLIFFKDEVIATDNNDDYFNLFIKYSNVIPKRVNNVVKYLDDNNLWDSVYKIIFSDEEEVLIKLRDDLSGKIDDDYNLTFSMPFYLELYDSNVSKGIALEFVANIYGINNEEIMAIGDGENDLSMIEFAKIGIAMENAPDFIKERANYITSSNIENGVFHAIKKFIYNE
ncbi:MAG: HAD family phosphatase [Tissierellales bacterium]|nr:HAD family phosphatase [Tissierellales bacterium]